MVFSGTEVVHDEAFFGKCNPFVYMVLPLTRCKEI